MTRIKKEKKEVAYTHYLAVVPDHWGKASTIQEAKAQLRKVAGKRKDSEIAIYHIPADYYIDDYGSGHGSGPAKLVTGPDHRD